MAESNHSPAAAFIRIRCRELGLSEARLVRLAGYKNEAKDIRRLDSLIAGDLETTRWLIQKLPAALNLPTDVISEVVDQTRQQIASVRRRQAEQAEMEWRDNFQPHAIILTERTRPEPVFVAAIIGAERLLRVDFDLDREGESYVKKSLEWVEHRLAKWNGTFPAFGRPTGLIVNYAPNFAVRFDLRGAPQEIFGEAYRIGQEYLLLKGRSIPSVSLPRAVPARRRK
jgi:hypothetical protein